MLGNSKLMAFVGTAAPEAARAFYEQTLGLKLLADEPSALVFDANGTMLRVSKVADLHPAPLTVLGWEVEDIRARMETLTTRGVQFERFEGLAQDDQGVMEFPGGTLVAWFRDPDGNLLSLTQFPR